MIIGICGKAGSGKDTIADILVKDFGFVKVAFADPLKRVCKEIFEFSNEQLWGPSDKRNEPDFRYCRTPHQQGYDPVSGRPTTIDAEYLTPRYALQKLGTEWGRDCYPDIWIEYAMRVAKRLLSGGPLNYDPSVGLRTKYVSDPEIRGVVISDVRFINEVEGLRTRGAKVIKVTRPMQGLKGTAATHRSETEQDAIPDASFDEFIKNDGSLEDLVVMTQGIISKLQIEKRDQGFAEMLQSIPETQVVQVGIDLAAGPDTTSIVSVRPSHPPEVVHLSPEQSAAIPLAQVVHRAPDGTEVLPEETPAQERLRGMLEDRQRDVDAGKIMEFDPAQRDVPPFLRKKT